MHALKHRPLNTFSTINSRGVNTLVFDNWLFNVWILQLGGEGFAVATVHNMHPQQNRI